MRKTGAFNTLRFKLGVMAVILIMIPIAVISITYSKTVKEIIKDKYSRTALESVYETGEKIEFILDDVQEFSTVIISNEDFLNMLRSHSKLSRDKYRDELRDFITLRDDIEAIHLCLDGTFYRIGAKETPPQEFIYDKVRRSSGQPIWIHTRKVMVEILSGEFEKRYFTLGRKIVDFNTLDEYGYLMMDFDEVILQQAYTNLLEDDGADIFIVNEVGRIISHSDKNKIGESIIFEPYANEMLSDKTGYKYIHYNDGIDKVAIYSTIEGHGWKVVKTVSTRYLYGELDRIQRYLVFGELIYVIIMLIFMIIFSVKYTDPMISMMGVMKRVEQGDLSVRTDIRSNDEIGELAHSLNNMIEKMQELIDRLVREEKEKKEVELEALHAQINPHFLYNTLNTIKWMAKIQGNKRISSAITALIKLLRISINLGREMISLEEEIEHVKNYVVIQKLRFNESITVEFDIEPGCIELNVPKLILQPIVENSIIHGMEGEEEGININIRAARQNGSLIVQITDDGPGMDSDTLDNIFKRRSAKSSFSAVGLNNVNQRIKLYCGDEYGLNIESEKGKGTNVTAALAVKGQKS
ncbi:two-component system, sensor histidine kinase YesM [Peptoclostridium litorale DSM 5388]|uniref:histidine kinase n=1 Tax=Peptoclostridium litorale DSM 5388 TaxID=1121324 RepID=A0A069RH14_PEPLI|nr:sensor histidine kinase [Peptoclostridium litorale]KDR96329.1 HAMP domain-containing protein [Peptoclostridium litorale DSM 5388]SIO26473.1 two-component system, sensor histidine kinase YesM [Peptoclostridium litorale DSM 5388]